MKSNLNTRLSQLKSLLNIILLVSVSCSLASCDKTFKSEKDLVNYINNEENDYKQHKKVNGVDFTLLYKPTDLLVSQEIGGEKKVTKAKIKELRNKYNKYMYFYLSMSMNNKELLSAVPKNRNEFGAMVNQLAFGMKDKVHLFNTRKDTIQLADYIYPRMYSMSQSTAMLFVFPREQEKLNEKELNFTIEDLGMYTGEVKFKINTKLITKNLKIVYEN